MSSYHNTTNSDGADLVEYELKADTQEALIFAFFESHPDRELSPSYVHQHVLPRAPITSVRRAISNLTHAGLLTKTDTQLDGPYGRPEYLWQLTRPTQGRLPL